ncbi:MAG: 30S ribosome-binding factor RbfA [Propionibacteriaceae bacterium]|jgi:ribosome-binding factor A|nr:30S ribosome-binding factor RbfA [Propionibacteriaceae bacterium]
MPTTASLKVAEQIKTTIAGAIGRELADPRLGFLTITQVRLSKDWHVAEVFYTVLGDDQAQRAASLALADIKGPLRALVARKLPMRFTPTLEFLPDRLPETSAQFDDLLAKVKAADAAKAAGAVGASYAGDADPYKHPEADED